jgi:hypothetical protein
VWKLWNTVDKFVTIAQIIIARMPLVPEQAFSFCGDVINGMVSLAAESITFQEVNDRNR